MSVAHNPRQRFSVSNTSQGELPVSLSPKCTLQRSPRRYRVRGTPTRYCQEVFNQSTVNGSADAGCQTLRGQRFKRATSGWRALEGGSESLVTIETIYTLTVPLSCGQVCNYFQWYCSSWLKPSSSYKKSCFESQSESPQKAISHTRSIAPLSVRKAAKK